LKEGSPFEVTSLGRVYKICRQNPLEENIKHLNTLTLFQAPSIFLFLAAGLTQLKQLCQTYSSVLVVRRLGFPPTAE